MKKSLIVVALLVLAVGAFAADFNGGAARIEALGGQKIVVPDISAANDLYDMGFSSGIFAREKKSFVSIIPTLDAFIYEQAEKDEIVDAETSKFTTLGLGNAAKFNQYEGAAIWLSKQSVISVKPYLSGRWGQLENFQNDDADDKTKIDLAPHTLGGVIEYGHEIGGIMLSGSLSYGKTGLDMKIVDDGGNTITIGTGKDKVEYALSAALNVTKDIAVALNIGNKISPLPGTNSAIRETAGLTGFMGMDADYSVMNQLYNNRLSLQMEDAFVKMKMAADIVSEGLVADAGIAVKGTDGGLISGKLGLISGAKAVITEKMEAYDKVTGDKLGEDKYTNILYEEGAGINALVNIRKNLGGILVGFKGNLAYTAANEGASAGKIQNTVYGAVVGAAVGYKSGLMIPVELFVNGIDRKYVIADTDEYTRTYDVGARAGVELMMGDMALRLGADYAAAGEYTANKDEGNYSFQSAGAGTEYNPYTMQLGVNAGIGLKLFGAETNLSVRYEPKWTQYEIEDLKKEMNGVIRLMADMKFYL